MSAPELLSVPNPFLLEHSRLRVLEALDTPVDALYARLLDGTYDKPFIIEDGQLRYLHLGITFIQSVMRIDEPDALDLRYTQKMMAFLLFKRAPKQIVLLGLGGGSLAKFCYRTLPAATITAIEIDPDVIALRSYFAIPADDARFCVVRDDATDFIAHRSDAVDVLLVDAFDAEGLALSLASREFFLRAHSALRESGILVMNLAGEKSRYTDIIDEAREVFDYQMILVPVRDDGNHILFAFKQRLFEPDWKQLKQRAKELKAKYGLDFPAFAQKMEHATRGRGSALQRVIDTMARTKKRAAGRNRPA
jgi:spermidine synthase